MSLSDLIGEKLRLTPTKLEIESRNAIKTLSGVNYG